MADCNFWDCSEAAPADGSLCGEHEPHARAGLIDMCPDCHFHKRSGEELCGDCARWDRFSVPENGYDVFEGDDFLPDADDWERTLVEYSADSDDEY